MIWPAWFAQGCAWAVFWCAAVAAGVFVLMGLENLVHAIAVHAGVWRAFFAWYVRVWLPQRAKDGDRP